MNVFNNKLLNVPSSYVATAKTIYISSVTHHCLTSMSNTQSCRQIAFVNVGLFEIN